VGGGQLRTAGVQSSRFKGFHAEPIGLYVNRLLKNSRSPFENLRGNGVVVEMIDHFPFVLSLSKHSWVFQQRVKVRNPN